VLYFSRVLRYLRPYWKLAIVSVALILLGTLAGLLAPWPLQILFDNVLDDKPLAPLMATLLGALGENRVRLMFTVVVGGVLITAATRADRAG
jgi:ABC-type multidrug transport system fused ATPase/permease subunit